MSAIDFSKKLSVERPYNHNSYPVEKEYEIIRRFESDRGRILNSAAVRRLQQKTQVFPLERNSAVRSRLTHSMEVQQVGRYIAKEILNKLENKNLIEFYKLDHYKVPFESLVEMACLMHDIGNPPFGHFGEVAINDWFRQYLSGDYCCHDKRKQYFDTLSGNDELKQKIKEDLCHFEGNAQGIRLIQTLQKLNLTYAQTACILKYTRPAYLPEQDIPIKFDYLMKKPGYYLAEEAFIDDLRSVLGIEEYCRHPLTYIMEAADDISYCIADLEDAVEKSILSVEQLYSALKHEWEKLCGSLTKGDFFSKTIEKAYQHAQKNEPKESSEYYRNQNDLFFIDMRVKTMLVMVNCAADNFIDNISAIFQGNFNQPLIPEEPPKDQPASSPSTLLAIYKRVATEKVFCHDEVEQRELQGYRILSGLLDVYRPLLSIPYADFTQLVKQKKHKGYLIETRLFNKLPSKHLIAYREAMSNVIKAKYQEHDIQLWEFYYRCRLIIDYISGMTDHYAFDEYRKMNAMIL